MRVWWRVREKRLLYRILLLYVPLAAKNITWWNCYGLKSPVPGRPQPLRVLLLQNVRGSSLSLSLSNRDSHVRLLSRLSRLLCFWSLLQQDRLSLYRDSHVRLLSGFFPPGLLLKFAVALSRSVSLSLNLDFLLGFPWQISPFTQGYDITAHECVPGQRHALVVNRVFEGGRHVGVPPPEGTAAADLHPLARWAEEVSCLSRLRHEDRDAPFLVSFPEDISCLGWVRCCRCCCCCWWRWWLLLC